MNAARYCQLAGLVATTKGTRDEHHTKAESPHCRPVASWNEGKTKQSIVTFVERVTKPGSPDFVPPAERIATFDNDGTLWCEQLVPVQFYFALDRLKTLAPQHPKWKTKGLFASLLK